MTEKIDEIIKELECARQDKSSCPLCETTDNYTEFEHVDFHVDNAIRMLKEL